MSKRYTGAFTWILFFFLLAATNISCQKLKPITTSLNIYPDLERLMHEQAGILKGSSLEKTVLLDSERASKVFRMDSTAWIKALDFLKEINPNQVEYVNALEKTSIDSQILLQLKDGERGALKRLQIQEVNGKYQRIEATFHENKDIYTHHRKIRLVFNSGQLASYEITGYQKMIFKDTITFGIVGKVR